jgi:hypothetical protein
VKKKIIIRITGGLGNQFFIYNYYLFLKQRFPNSEIRFDKTPYFKLFSNEKNDFHVKYKINYVLDLFYDLNYINKLSAKIVYNIAKWNKRCFKSPMLPMLMQEEDIKDDPGVLEKYDRVVISGHFISRKYLVDEPVSYSKSIKLNETQKQMLKEIQNQNSVSIHIRGDQYLTHSKVILEYAPIQKEYYQKAIEYINTKIKDPVFYVFTNDMEFSRSVLNGEHSELIFADKNTEVVDFHLMSNCKNNIIINSTFSWWAAYLNQHKNKIVVAPKAWSGEVVVNPDYNALPLEDWIKL